MKTVAVIFMIWVIMLPVMGDAQTQSNESRTFNASDYSQKPSGFLDSLLDPSRFSMHHSYSLAYSSFGGQGISRGLYLNTMNFQFSDPLSMQVRVGYFHQPFGGTNQSSGVNKVFLERAMLQYKPSESLSIKVDYRQIPSPLFYPYQSW